MGCRCGSELSGLMKNFTEEGVKFTYTAKGGRAIGYRPGWYWKE